MKRNKYPLIIILAALVLVVATGIVWMGVALAPQAPLESATKIETSPGTELVAHETIPPQQVQIAKPVVRTTSTAPSDHAPLPEEEFRRTQECVSTYRQAMTVQSQLNVCRAADAPQNPMCESASLAALSAKLVEHSRAAVNCGEDISALEVEYFKRTRDLAIRGNADAQICFAQSRFDIGRPWSEEEVSFYKSNVPIFLQNAFERGDWRAVQLFATPRRVLAHSHSLLSFIVPIDQVEQYKLNRLLRLGAVDGYAEQLDALSLDPELPIDPEKQKAAEDWAQKEYDRYFRSSPKLSEAPQPCLVHG